jgi:hypothetical protein
VRTLPIHGRRVSIASSIHPAMRLDPSLVAGRIARPAMLLQQRRARFRGPFHDPKDRGDQIE